MSHSVISSSAPRALVARVIGLGLLSLAGLLGSKSPASAQSLCLPQGEIAKLLSTHYTETPVAYGLASAGKLIQVFSTGDSATWTIVVTSPQGQSCVVATGEAWPGNRRSAPDPQA